jgi:RecA-family ATPase
MRPREDESYEDFLRRMGGHTERRSGKKRPNGYDNDDSRHAAEHTLPEIIWRDQMLSNFNGQEIPERLWVVPDWIPREQVTGLYGVAGINKTDFILQCQMARSEGLVFLGHKLEAGPTYGLYCEDTVYEIVRRAGRIAGNYGRTLADFSNFHFASLVGLDDPEFVYFDGNLMRLTESLLRFDRKIVELNAGFAVLDTAPHFFGGNEVTRREVTKFVRKLDAISITRVCGILFSAHPSIRGKNSKTFDSGSTAWEAGVRSRLSLHDPGERYDDEGTGPPLATDTRILTRWKSNYARSGETLELVCRDGFFKPAAVDAEKAANHQRGPARDAACDATFLRLIRDVDRSGRYVNNAETSPSRYAPRVFNGMAEGKEYSIPEFKRSMARLFDEERIRMEPFGPPSKGWKRIAAVRP